MDQKKVSNQNIKKFNNILQKKYNTLTFSLKEKIDRYTKSIYNN